MRTPLMSVATIAVGIALATPVRADTANLEGEIRSALDGFRVADALPVVVYLDSLDPAFSPPVPPETPLVTQAGARFQPRFSVVAAGQRVEMRNDDSIFHNVFSYSKPNDFDFGVYPEGESRFKVFEEPGLVRFYCSIHEPMNGVIFVAPSPYFSTVDRRGVFRIASVPAGEYRLRTWSARLPEQRREIVVEPGKTLRLELKIGEQSGVGTQGTRP